MADFNTTWFTLQDKNLTQRLVVQGRNHDAATGRLSGSIHHNQAVMKNLRTLHAGGRGAMEQRTDLRGRFRLNSEVLFVGRAAGIANQGCVMAKTVT
ncbi:hypothetical protein PSYMO_39935 [Pseudomonas amygdali pv. mori str. 301020]|uniref:Uncharacterized protein n=2 Tax=Pseudomonas syringae group genomosp. 2 TaxID=251698 RepID=A0A656GPE6_PSEA0|nr:hypothetical protein PSYMO_39935 [Pseudomonas amygdali pv. mori str. 301020]